ncbi:Spo0B domain-containing protein [Paenibacillus doosanensis]|nr:Spo0B domain-containing protein [Paenibacillus doosanensis]
MLYWKSYDQVRIGEVTGMISNERDNEPNRGFSCLPTGMPLSEEQETEHNLRFIRLLNHYRHDWMNEIQVLFGYVKLKKYDKLADLMEKIKHKVQQESYIAKLGVPDLVVYLLSFQTEVKEVGLDIRLDQEIHLDELPVDTRRINNLMSGVMDAFKENARKYAMDEAHRLILRLEKTPGTLSVTFDYHGQVEAATLGAALERVRSQSVPAEYWETLQWETNQAVVKIALSLNT